MASTDSIDGRSVSIVMAFASSHHDLFDTRVPENEYEALDCCRGQSFHTVSRKTAPLGFLCFVSALCRPGLRTGVVHIRWGRHALRLAPPRQGGRGQDPINVLAAVTTAAKRVPSRRTTIMTKV